MNFQFLISRYLYAKWNISAWLYNVWFCFTGDWIDELKSLVIGTIVEIGVFTFLNLFYCIFSILAVFIEAMNIKNIWGFLSGFISCLAMRNRTFGETKMRINFLKSNKICQMTVSFCVLIVVWCIVILTSKNCDLINIYNYHCFHSLWILLTNRNTE